MDAPTPIPAEAAAPARVTLTLAGFWLGVRMMVPVMPGVCVFATVFGAAAAEKGLSLAQALGMSAFVYAGASQMVALQMWRDPWTFPALATLFAVTFTVNARMILMGASLQPWLAQGGRRGNALNLYFLTDANWLMGTRYHTEGGRDLGMLLGAGVALWVLWVGMTLPGHIAGSLVAEPRRWGLDLVLPVFFAIMLAPLWRGVRPALPWLVAAGVALAVERLAGGYLHILAGALAGALTGALTGREGGDARS